MLKYRQSGILRLAAIAAGLLIMFNSCSIERKLADDYLKTKASTAVLLIPAELVLKTGYKVPPEINTDSVPENELEDLLLQYTELIQFVDDSTFIDGYMSGLTLGLRRAGYQVFKGDNTHSFFSAPSKRIIMHLAQLQLEEFYIPVEESASFDDEESYSYEFYITGININSWFEISGVNLSDSIIRVLYNSETVSDIPAVDYRYFAISNEIKFLYSVDSLNIYDVYQAGWNTGFFNANNFNNYMINRHVANNMPNGRKPTRSFVYDRNSGRIRQSKQQGFIEIE